MTEWPPAHIEELRRLVEQEHLSATQAASVLNKTFRTAYSRNAVIGKCKRSIPPIRLAAGKGGRPGPKGGPSQRKKRPRAMTPQQRPDIADRKAASGPMVPPRPFVARTAEVQTHDVPLLELADDGCKWPSGGWPDATPVTFCNHRQLDGLSYCAPHQRIARGEPAPWRVQGFWPR